MKTTHIYLRRGKAAEWAESNPVLHEGEPGWETDTGVFKIGDGETPWNDLGMIGFPVFQRATKSRVYRIVGT